MPGTVYMCKSPVIFYRARGERVEIRRFGAITRFSGVTERGSVVAKYEGHYGLLLLLLLLLFIAY